jgi:PAS domain S-box-containing protein
MRSIPPLSLLRAYEQAIDVNIICSITDKSGKLIYANVKFCEVCGYSSDELIGRSHNIINSGLHNKAFFTDMWKTIAGGEVWRGEMRNKAKNGSFYWVDTVILPIFDSEQKIIQYMSLRYLINEKKQMEKEREEHIKSLEKMMEITSHNVRKPIASCLGLLHLMEKPLAPQDLSNFLDHMKTSAEELDRYTRELTDFLHRLRSSRETARKEFLPGPQQDTSPGSC